MRKPKKRQCSVCGEMKPLSEFYTYKYKGRTYTRGFCNAVRGCKGCCKTCADECNSGHDCEHEVNPDGMDSVWWNSIVRAMRDDMIYDSQPDHLKRWMDKMMSLWK